MSLRTDLINDLDDFLNNEEFAVEVQIGERIIYGIFDDEYNAVNIQTGEIAQTEPQVIVKSSDIENLALDTEIIINGIVYKVKEIQPDGTGLTTLILSKD